MVSTQDIILEIYVLVDYMTLFYKARCQLNKLNNIAQYLPDNAKLFLLELFFCKKVINPEQM